MIEIGGASVGIGDVVAVVGATAIGGFLRGLEFVEGLALLGQVSEDRGGAEEEHRAGGAEDEVEGVFHGGGWDFIWNRDAWFTAW